jgi:hypothetical protein
MESHDERHDTVSMALGNTVPFNYLTATLPGSRCNGRDRLPWSLVQRSPMGTTRKHRPSTGDR